MHRRLGVLLLAGIAMAALPLAAAALGLDVEAKGGVGFALGSTDNSDVTGIPRVAGQGGISADLYLLTAGPVDLGIAAGAEYAYLTTHSTWKNYGSLGSDQTTDGRYNYLIFPISLVARYPLSQSVQLTAHLGGFIGYFVSGKYDLSWDPQNPGFGLVNSTDNKFNSDTTNKTEYGIHATAGADVAIMPNVSVSPALQLDMGLTDNTPNTAAPPAGTNGDFKDTIWSLTFMVGIKYKAL